MAEEPKPQTSVGQGGRMYVRTDGTQAEIYVQPPDEHPIYAKIGRIASEWSHYEHALDEIIWTLCGGSVHGLACITGQMMGHGPRYNAIIALLTARGAPEKAIKRIERLRNKAFDAVEYRNRIVHDAWYLTNNRREKAFAQFRSMSPKDLRFGLVDLITDDYFAVALKKAEECRTEAVGIWNEIFLDRLNKQILTTWNAALRQQASP